MGSFTFKKWNIFLGWFVFSIALVTYWSTVEPTASFWDAGEYITTASNLEVGHPPGAPLYQLLGAFFSIFAIYLCKLVHLYHFRVFFFFNRWGSF